MRRLRKLSAKGKEDTSATSTSSSGETSAGGGGHIDHNSSSSASASASTESATHDTTSINSEPPPLSSPTKSLLVTPSAAAPTIKSSKSRRSASLMDTTNGAGGGGGGGNCLSAEVFKHFEKSGKSELYGTLFFCLLSIKISVLRTQKQKKNIWVTLLLKSWTTPAHESLTFKVLLKRNCFIKNFSNCLEVSNYIPPIYDPVDLCIQHSYCCLLLAVPAHLEVNEITRRPSFHYQYHYYYYYLYLL